MPGFNASLENLLLAPRHPLINIRKGAPQGRINLGQDFLLQFSLHRWGEVRLHQLEVFGLASCFILTKLSTAEESNPLT